MRIGSKLIVVFFLISVTKLNIYVVNTVMCYICVVYTMLGGIQAVVWTDVIYLKFSSLHLSVRKFESGVSLEWFYR